MEYYEQLVGDGETKTFYFTFPFFGVNDIHVTIDGIEQTTDNYTMTPTQTPNDADTEYTGGSIEFLTAPESGATIVIYLEIELVRHIDYQPTKKPESHELNQDFNQCMGALRELKIKLQNTLNLATIPTLTALLEELTAIRTALGQKATKAELADVNNTIEQIQAAITSLAGYDYVVESQLPTATNNYTWYRKYKSGWVEQGGYRAGSGTWTIANITLPIEMSNACYALTVTGDSSTNDFTSSEAMVKRAGTRSCVCNRSTTGFGCQSNSNISWHVYGIPA